MELKWKSCLRAGITVMVVFLLIHYWTAFAGILQVAFSAAVPLLLGCAIAYVVNILMSFYERSILCFKEKHVLYKLRRPIAIVLAYLSIVLIIFFIVGMVVPELVDCGQILIEKLPKALENIRQWLEENMQLSSFLQDENNLSFDSEADWKDIITKAIGVLFTGVGNAMGVAISVISSVFSTVVTVLVALIFSIYLLFGKEKIGRQIILLMNRYLPGKAVNTAFYVARTLDEAFHSFIVGQCMEAVILGLLCMVGMLILRIPYAVMLGCLIGFTALIPVAGAYIGAVAGAFIIFTVSPVKAVVFLIFLVILQQLEGNLIYPRVVGSSIGLPGIWVLAAVTVGGGVMGISGMLLGVPLAAAAYRLLKNDIKNNSDI